MSEQTESESIKTLVDQIDADRLVLPEFQRDFKWDLKRTYDLFDSIVRDVFIGPLIYGIPSFPITTRAVDDPKGPERRGDRSSERIIP
jgi:uncharacterized protein with ParB-like and HNH nuclease domain